MDPDDIDAFRTSVLDLLNHINGTDEFPIENRCKYIKEAIDLGLRIIHTLWHYQCKIQMREREN